MDQEIDSHTTQRFSQRLLLDEKRKSSFSSLDGSRTFLEKKSSQERKQQFNDVMGLEGSYNTGGSSWFNSFDRHRTLARIPHNMQDLIEQEHTFQKRNSINQRKTHHECSCEGICNQYHCPCLNELKEQCIIGECCHNCILQKNRLVKEQIKKNKEGCVCKNSRCLKSYCKCFQAGKKCIQGICQCKMCENNTDKVEDRKDLKIRKDFEVGCTCKRSHCLKRYCKCFTEGKPCGEACLCENCHNRFDGENMEQFRLERQKYHRMQEDSNDWIDRYLAGSDYQNQEMPRSMEFQHPNLMDSYNRN